MPHVNVDTTKGRTPEQKRALMDTVHAAMVEALQIPEDDRQVRLIEHEPENIMLPPDKTASYVLIEVTGYPRSLEVKRDLYAAFVRNLEKLGVGADDVLINYFDVGPDNWGVQGGVAGSDLAARGGTGNWSARY